MATKKTFATFEEIAKKYLKNKKKEKKKRKKSLEHTPGRTRKLFFFVRSNRVFERI
jgi:hypothetical protein